MKDQRESVEVNSVMKDRKCQEEQAHCSLPPKKWFSLFWQSAQYSRSRGKSWCLCGAGEDSWEFLRQQVNPKGNQPWIFIRSTDVEAEAPILWPPDVKSYLIGKRLWCWEGLRAGGEGEDRGWDGWMASPTQWTWVWVTSGSWWWTGRPGVLWSWGHKESDTTEWLNWTKLRVEGTKELTSIQLNSI